MNNIDPDEVIKQMFDSIDRIGMLSVISDNLNKDLVKRVNDLSAEVERLKKKCGEE